MLVRFWGTRGSLPVALTADAVRRKVANALLAADGRQFAEEGADLHLVIVSPELGGDRLRLALDLEVGRELWP